MSWTYISSMDEFDKEVQKDSSTTDRYTFNRYMYFKPDQYDKWVKGETYSGIPYSAELVGNPNIPSGGTHLGGSLSGFYVKDVISIKNLSEVEHGDACSYAVVTIQYENKKAASSGGGSSSSQPSQTLKPWQKKVEDFTVTNQEIQIPLVEGYDDSSVGGGSWETVATTAGQPLYGFTGSLWIQRLTWTYCCQNENYSISAPIINASNETVFGFPISKEAGLLLPPSYRIKYYYENESDPSPTEYQEWNFEIIVNEAQGFSIPILNAGTKFINSNGDIVDICTWYVYDPKSQTPPQKEFGDFGDMMSRKKLVDAFNKGKKEDEKKVWNGDFTQGPIPLTSAGGIDLGAVADPSSTFQRKYRQYDFGGWSLGVR